MRLGNKMRMRKCMECGEYTFKGTCPSCNIDTKNPAPPKFSPEDKYGEYRRKMMVKK